MLMVLNYWPAREERSPLSLAFLMLKVAEAAIITILTSTFRKEAAATTLPNKVTKGTQ
jgi:hypothetical protein